MTQEEWRMRKKILSRFAANHMKEYSSIYMFVMVLFLMGVIFGAIIVNSFFNIFQKPCRVIPLP